MLGFTGVVYHLYSPLRLFTLLETKHNRCYIRLFTLVETKHNRSYIREACKQIKLPWEAIVQSDSNRTRKPEVSHFTHSADL